MQNGAQLSNMTELLYEKNEHIAYITLNRPERLNAISRDLAAALVDSLAEYDNDPDLWACIITGAGDKSFSVGADLKDEKHLFDPEKWEAAFARNLFSIQKPLIAAINGYCLGAGFMVALACDIRIAAENARLGTPDQKLNTVDCAASILLSHVIPSSTAMEILFTGDPIDAKEAHRVGLVSRIVPPEKLMTEAGNIANKICENGPMALKVCKELNKRAGSLTIDESVALFEAMAYKVLRSEDTKEGITAFLEKRKPIWKGK
jgi:enoyl-CoA hydratase/carnithine racemase